MSYKNFAARTSYVTSLSPEAEEMLKGVALLFANTGVAGSPRGRTWEVTSRCKRGSRGLVSAAEALWT